jgi:hypothetical protein
MVSNMSRNPYNTVSISLILLADETQNEKADGRASSTQMTGVSLAALAARDTPRLQLCVITETLV